MPLLEEAFTLGGAAFLPALPFRATEMVVDFQHHYTPPELMETGKGDGGLRLDENGIQIIGSIHCSPIFLRMCG
jgi:hypothetical protein